MCAKCRNIKIGVDFIFPYTADKNKWTYPQDVSQWNEQPGRRPFLFLAALAYNNAEYLDVWKTIDANNPSDESRRNAPIKNPLLWIE